MAKAKSRGEAAVDPAPIAVAETQLAAASDQAAETTADGHSNERNCLNCGCPLHGDFCQCCGQKAHVHRTLGAFVHDLLHGLLHFEGKIWRTLPLLVWKPGELTRRYVEGQRARFVSPIALFLFSIFLMFAVVSATGSIKPGTFGSPDLAVAQKQAEDRLRSLAAQRSEAESSTEDLPGGEIRGSIDEDIAQTRAELDFIRRLRGLGVTEARYKGGRQELTSNLAWVEQAYMKAKRNPELLLYKAKTNAYKFSWALIPISVPFVWLLFVHRRRYREAFGAYDHIVFVTYSLAFMTLLMVVAMLASTFGLSLVSTLLILVVPPLHMYRQLKGAYGLSSGSAFWRTIAMTFFAVASLGLFVALLFTMGALE